MNYKFRCTTCNSICERDIPMDEYNKQKDKQICSCGGKLVRVIKWTGSASGSGDGWCGNSKGNCI